jgi:hypothetical protein
MSRMLRSATAVLVISVLACGSLQALPLAAWGAPFDNDRGNVLTAIVEWIGSIFAERPDSAAPASDRPKEGSIMDPDGND